MKDQHKWDKRMLELAKHIATWSKDPSSKVGAVICTDDYRIISTGYNGFASSVDDCLIHTQPREFKYLLTQHAEVNAIILALKHLQSYSKDYTIFVTHPCCKDCARLISSCGIIKRVVYYTSNDEGFNQRWCIDDTRTIFNHNQITVTELTEVQEI